MVAKRMAKVIKAADPSARKHSMPGTKPARQMKKAEKEMERKGMKKPREHYPNWKD